MMDLFWSGLTERASEHTTVIRKSQFSKVFDSVLKDIEMQARKEDFKIL